MSQPITRTVIMTSFVIELISDRLTSMISDTNPYTLYLLLAIFVVMASASRANWRDIAKASIVLVLTISICYFQEQEQSTQHSVDTSPVPQPERQNLTRYRQIGTFNQDNQTFILVVEQDNRNFRSGQQAGHLQYSRWTSIIILLICVFKQKAHLSEVRFFIYT